MQITFSAPLPVAPSRDGSDLSADTTVSDASFAGGEAIFTLTPAPVAWQPAVPSEALRPKAKTPFGFEPSAMVPG